MDLWEKSKLLIFIVFVIPGFISMKLYNILNPNENIDTTKTIIEVITYSCINYAIWFCPIYYIETTSFFESPFTYSLFYLFVLFLSPIILTSFILRIRRCKCLNKYMPHPTGKAWDYVFSLKEQAWIIVTLKGGEKIAGKYGLNSFSSSSPNPGHLYLEENWVMNNDGGLERPRTDTKGILILSNDIETVEFFKIDFPD
ncbi:DUF6338 family protein [Pantoea stewartii]|uniref:Uncharacterized protein n=1 Tax=Pantoea stewartii TaxID=66269 RepID=A0AB34VMW9_9GAMM|nr:DUF6338 family protein [Pantoea stewartii]KTS74234.1 hypothetical protein RSA30_06230 [Pantoea stewartii]KTT00938.1 hypothetical protein RSA13_00475 [Pantoea stewartii]KTT08456.1 hypothetical protein RSA36_05520 [Pantoea stewartii]